MTDRSRSLIVLGRLVAPHGLRGWLRVHPFGDDPESWKSMAHWWLSAQADAAFDDWRAYPLVDVRVGGGLVKAKLAGVDDRTAAEALAGCYFGAERAALPATAAGEHYWSDLIGLVAVNRQGEVLGHVESLIETGANHVLVVRDLDDQERTRLIPFIAQVIDAVEVGEGRIQVDWGGDW